MLGNSLENLTPPLESWHPALYRINCALALPGGGLMFLLVLFFCKQLFQKNDFTGECITHCDGKLRIFICCTLW